MQKSRDMYWRMRNPKYRFKYYHRWCITKDGLVLDDGKPPMYTEKELGYTI